MCGFFLSLGTKLKFNIYLLDTQCVDNLKTSAPKRAAQDAFLAFFWGGGGQFNNAIVKMFHLLLLPWQIRKCETVSLSDMTVCCAEHLDCLQRIEQLPKSVQSDYVALSGKLMAISGSTLVLLMHKSISKRVMLCYRRGTVSLSCVVTT